MPFARINAGLITGRGFDVLLLSRLVVAGLTFSIYEMVVLTAYLLFNVFDDHVLFAVLWVCENRRRIASEIDDILAPFVRLVYSTNVGRMVSHYILVYVALRLVW